MSDFWSGIFIGLFVGCCVSLLIMGLLSTAREDKKRNAQWIEKVYDEVPHEPYLLYHCSLCDEPNARKKNYCPNCGAKMDGKGEGE